MPLTNFLSPKKVLSAGDMSGDLTTSAIDVTHIQNVALQVNFSGSPTGTFSVEGSVDHSNWNAITLSSSPAATGSAGSALVDMNQLSVPFVRVKYTFTSGTGSLDVWVSGKGF